VYKHWELAKHCRVYKHWVVGYIVLRNTEWAFDSLMLALLLIDSLMLALPLIDSLMLALPLIDSLIIKVFWRSLAALNASGLIINDPFSFCYLYIY